MLKKLDEELKNLIVEGETGEMMKEQFRGVSEFARLSDEDWIDLGKMLKSMKATKSVFTKAFGNFFRFLRYGGTIPTTPAEFAKFVQDNKIKITGWVKASVYPVGDAVLGTLEADGLLVAKGTGFGPTQKMNKIFDWFKSRGIDFTKKTWGVA